MGHSGWQNEFGIFGTPQNWNVVLSGGSHEVIGPISGRDLDFPEKKQKIKVRIETKTCSFVIDKFKNFWVEPMSSSLLADNKLPPKKIDIPENPEIELQKSREN